MVNPLALLAFVELALASLRTGVLPGWAAWTIIVWIAVWFLMPFPLALFLVPILFLAVLLVSG